MKRLLLVFLCLLLILFITSPIFAQSQPSIIVSPSISFLDLATDPPQLTLTYQNTTNYVIELDFSAQDFTQLEDDPNITFLNNRQEENYKYRLSPWISFEKASMTLSPGQKDTVTVYINQNRLTVGGHYAMILASMKQFNSNHGIAVNGKIASMLFVRTATGKEIEAAKVGFFNPIQNGWNFPQSFVMRFEDLGDVELIPYGLVQIKDFRGNVVANGILNDGSLLTLPESIKLYTIPITTLQPFILPGFYTASINIEYGKSKQHILTTSTFFTEGSVNLSVVTIIIIIAIAGFIFWRKYKNKLKPQSAKN